MKLTMEDSAFPPFTGTMNKKHMCYPTLYRE